MAMIPRTKVSLLAPGAADVIAARILGTEPAHLIGYWPWSEGSGSAIVDGSGNGRNGVYTGVTLGQAGIGDGRTCPFFDGANDCGNLYSAGLSAAWSWTAYSISVWLRMNSADVWSDGQLRAWVKLVAPNSADFIWIRKVSQYFNCWARQDSNDRSINVELSGKSGDWFHVGYTLATGGSAYRYVDGDKVTHWATVPSPAEASGLHADNALIGAHSTQPANPHHGYIAHVAFWDTQLSDDEMAALAAPC